MIVVYGTGWFTDLRLICAYCGVASMSFLILAMHFVYRAMVISRHFQNKNYSVIEINTETIAKIVIILIVEFIIWTAMCEVFLCYKDEYGSTIARLTSDLDDFPKENLERRLMTFLGTIDGQFNFPPFIAILSMIGICCISIAMIMLSSVRIIRLLNDKHQRRSTWRKHNYQLFVALYVQFLGPLILLYIPCICYLLLPIIPQHGFSSPPWLLSLLYSIYPIVDPLVMIVFIRDYRSGLYNMLRRALCLSSQKSSSAVMSINSQPTEQTHHNSNQ